MTIEDCLLHAMDRISTWQCPSEDFAELVTDQASMLAGISPDDRVDNAQISITEDLLLNCTEK